MRRYFADMYAAPNGAQHDENTENLIQNGQKVEERDIESTTICTVGQIVCPPSDECLRKANEFLKSNCNKTDGFQSLVSSVWDMRQPFTTGHEYFTSAVALDVVKDLFPHVLDASVKHGLLNALMLPDGSVPKGTYNFHSTPMYHNDIDTTSAAILTLYNQEKVKKTEVEHICAVIAENINKETGILETFFPGKVGTEKTLNSDSDYPTTEENRRLAKTDIPWKGFPVFGALANATRLIHVAGMTDRITKTLEFLKMCIVDDKEFETHLVKGRCYDVNASIYWMSNCIGAFGPVAAGLTDNFDEKLVKEKLISRLAAQFGTTRHSNDISFRILAAANLGLLQHPDFGPLIQSEVNVLKQMQQNDGSWPQDTFHSYKEKYFGCAAITTAFAMKAVHLASLILKQE